MLGDSITAGWRLNESPTHLIADWNKIFPNYSVWNRGAPGANTWGVEGQINQAYRANYKPRVIVLLIGTNDSQGNTSFGQNVSIADHVKGNVQSLRSKFPESRVLVVSVPPQLGTRDVEWGNPQNRNPILQDLNRKIEEKVDGDSRVSFVNIWQGFFHADGRLKAGAFTDAVHLTNEDTRAYDSESGYFIYASALKEKLDALMLLGNGGNQYPEIGRISDLVLPSTGGEPEARVRVSVSDDTTPLSQLLARARVSSANPRFLPSQNISLQAVEGGLVLNLVPAQSIGSSKVTLEIEDGGGLVSRRDFRVFRARQVPELVIYSGGFQNGCGINNSLNTGINSEYLTASGDGRVLQVEFHRPNGVVNVRSNNVPIDDFDSIELQIHGGDIGGQELSLNVGNQRRMLPRLPQGKWGRFKFSLRELKDAGVRHLPMIGIQEFAFRNGQVFGPGKPLSPIYIGEIVLKPVFKTAPVISSGPMNRVASIGSEVSFGVVASAEPSPTYQWEFSTGPNAPFQRIPGAEDAIYKIPVVGRADDRRLYRCIVQNELGEVVSSPARLNLLPWIERQPDHQNVRFGERARFTVLAAGTNLKYQWQVDKRGTEIFENTSQKSAGYVTLPLSSANLDRKFRCVISNEFGSVTTNAVTLGLSGGGAP
jgi:hypothetical protein